MRTGAFSRHSRRVLLLQPPLLLYFTREKNKKEKRKQRGQPPFRGEFLLHSIAAFAQPVGSLPFAAFAPHLLASLLRLLSGRSFQFMCSAVSLVVSLSPLLFGEGCPLLLLLLLPTARLHETRTERRSFIKIPRRRHNRRRRALAAGRCGCLCRRSVEGGLKQKRENGARRRNEARRKRDKSKRCGESRGGESGKEKRDRGLGN